MFSNNLADIYSCILLFLFILLNFVILILFEFILLLIVEKLFKSILFLIGYSLKVKDFHLPNTITDFAPIAGKAVFSTWKDQNGEKWVSLDYVYPSTKQVREREVLSESNAPVAFPLEIEGLEKNDKGMYKLSDVQKRFDEAISVPNQYK